MNFTVRNSFLSLVFLNFKILTPMVTSVTPNWVEKGHNQSIINNKLCRKGPNVQFFRIQRLNRMYRGDNEKRVSKSQHNKHTQDKNIQLYAYIAVRYIFMSFFLWEYRSNLFYCAIWQWSTLLLAEITVTPPHVLFICDESVVDISQAHIFIIEVLPSSYGCFQYVFVQTNVIKRLRLCNAIKPIKFLYR